MGLLIVGAHRSGTSMVAQVAATVGIPMGDGPIMTATPENPAGFFERFDLMEINDQLLKDLGGAWYAPPAVSAETWTNLDQHKLTYLRNSVDLLKSPDNPWFIKDPRLSLLIPIWDRLALQALPIVFAVRNPTSVAQSLHLRNGFTHRRGLALWWAYNAAIISELGNRDFLIVDYDTALRHKTDTVSQLFVFASSVTNLSTVGTSQNQLEETSWLETAGIDQALLQRQASKSMSKNLARNRSVRRLTGVAAPQLKETLELYYLLREEHGYQNTEFDPVELPDWVHEELNVSRVDYRNRLVISDLTDRVALANIEINTLKENPPTIINTNEKEIVELTGQLKALDYERSNALAAAELLKQQLDKLESELSQKSNQLQGVQLVANTQSETIVDLEHKLAQYEIERNSAQAKAISLQSELIGLQKKLDAALVLNGNNFEKINQLRTKAIEFEGKWTRAESRIKQLEIELQDNKKSLEAEIVNTIKKSTQLDKLRAELVKLEQANSATQTAMSANHFELANSKLALHSLSNELAEITAELRAAEVENVKLVWKSKAIANLERQLLIEVHNTKNLYGELTSIRGSKAFKLATIIWRWRAK